MFFLKVLDYLTTFAIIITIKRLKKEKPMDKNKWEWCGYAGLALTILGQCLVGIFYLAGQGCWLLANALYLTKAVKQNLGRAEVVRNCAMSAITFGLMLIYWFAK